MEVRPIPADSTVKKWLTLPARNRKTSTRHASRPWKARKNRRRRCWRHCPPAPPAVTITPTSEAPAQAAKFPPPDNPKAEPSNAKNADKKGTPNVVSPHANKGPDSAVVTPPKATIVNASDSGKANVPLPEMAMKMKLLEKQQQAAYDDLKLTLKKRTEAFEEAKKLANEQKAAGDALKKGKLDEVQTGPMGVNQSIYADKLRNQMQTAAHVASRTVQNRNCLEVDGVWIDTGFTDKTPTVVVKAMSKAYFKILERQPSVRKVFQLGVHVVWITPSGTALVIDTNDGREEMSDADIDRLFVPPTKK